MRSSSVFAAAAAFGRITEATSNSVSYQGTFLVSSACNFDYTSAQLRYDTTVRDLVPKRARRHKNLTRYQRAKIVAGIIIVALTVTYLVLHCFILIKPKKYKSAARRRLAMGGVCSVSHHDAVRLLTSHTVKERCFDFHGLR